MYVQVGTFIVFRADYCAQSRRYVINYWTRSQKESVPCRRVESKYIVGPPILFVIL